MQKSEAEAYVAGHLVQAIAQRLDALKKTEAYKLLGLDRLNSEAAGKAALVALYSLEGQESPVAPVSPPVMKPAE